MAHVENSASLTLFSSKVYFRSLFRTSLFRLKHRPRLLENRMTDPTDSTSPAVVAEQDLRAEIAAARAEIARLNSELEDLQILYQGTIEHGEAVEDQLA